jgi:hypothetical protein
MPLQHVDGRVCCIMLGPSSQLKPCAASGWETSIVMQVTTVILG